MVMRCRQLIMMSSPGYIEHNSASPLVQVGSTRLREVNVAAEGRSIPKNARAPSSSDRLLLLYDVTYRHSFDETTVRGAASVRIPYLIDETQTTWRAKPAQKGNLRNTLGGRSVLYERHGRGLREH